MSTVTASPENSHYSFPPARDSNSTMAGRPLSGGAAPSPAAPRPMLAPAPFGAVAARGRSGSEIAATVIVGATVLVTVALFLTYYSGMTPEYDIAYSLARIVLGGVWHVVAGFVLCLRRRAVAGSAVAVVVFVPSVAADVINVVQHDAVMRYGNTFSTMVAVAVVVAVALLAVFIVVLVDESRASRLRPRSLQLSEAAAVYVTVSAGAFLVNEIHALMGHPLFGGAAKSYSTDPVAFSVGSAIVVLPGIAALAALRFRCAHAVYVVLVPAQTVAWVTNIVMYDIWLAVAVFYFNPAAMVLPAVSNALVFIFVIAFAFLAWRQSARQWFAGTWAPVVRPPVADVTVLAAVPAATVLATAAPQRTVGADGRACTMAAATPAPASPALVAPAATPTTMSTAMPTTAPVLSPQIASLLPPTRPVFWISLLFGLFGLIPMSMANGTSRGLGVVTNSYNQAFIKGFLSGLAVWGLAILLYAGLLSRLIWPH